MTKILNAFRKYGARRTMRYGLYAVAERLMSNRLRSGMLHGLAKSHRLRGDSCMAVTVNDVTLHIDPRNYWSLGNYYFHPYYDRAEIAAVKRSLPKDYDFVDIGANFGAWTFSLRDHFTRVLSVEPDPSCFSCLEKTGATGKRNVTLVNVGLAGDDGDGQLFRTTAHAGDSRIYNPGDTGRQGGTPLRLRSFDSLADEFHLSDRLFIKLDVQGYETKAIGGMQRTLARAKDVILFAELQQSVLAAAGTSVNEFLDLIRGLGFVPVDLCKDLAPASWQQVLDTRGALKDFTFRLSRA